MNNFLNTHYTQEQLDKAPFFLIAGPCAVEGESICFDIANQVKAICTALNIPYVFKASYRKANRTSGTSFTGLGDNVGLDIVNKIGKTLQVPTTTDVHSAIEATAAGNYVDILQIPAFLCRQTDILIAAAETGKVVNVKKGQFLSGSSMGFAVDKIKKAGNNNVLLTERGNTFGYQDLVVDYRNIPIMKAFNVPVVMDCTHSLQQPNQSSGITGGNPNFIELMAKCALAAGANGLFIETHPSPKDALSDGANMLPLHLLEGILTNLVNQFGAK
jgi:2-dehydro-3-deoxyphosphooctonate aldolase (KDO 8-P synthase)